MNYSGVFATNYICRVAIAGPVNSPQGYPVRPYRNETAHKVEIVRRANRAKFTQNKGLRRKLFQTGSKLLVEASPHDAIWGIGLDAETARRTPAEQWTGQNHLGIVITEIREELRAAYPEEASSVESDRT